LVNNAVDDAVTGHRWVFTCSVPAWGLGEWSVVPGESGWTTSGYCWCCCMSTGCCHCSTHRTWSVRSFSLCRCQGFVQEGWEAQNREKITKGWRKKTLQNSCDRQWKSRIRYILSFIG